MDALHPCLIVNHYIDRGTRALASSGLETFARKPDANPLGGLAHNPLLRAPSAAA